MKLEKLKMPEKKAKKSGADLELRVEGSPEEEASETPEEEQHEEDSGMDLDKDDADENDQGKGDAKLASVSDDDLLAEVKKRGLDLKSNKDESTGDDQSMYS